jgi:hypothetical protein
LDRLVLFKFNKDTTGMRQHGIIGQADANEVQQRCYPGVRLRVLGGGREDLIFSSHPKTPIARCLYCSTSKMPVLLLTSPYGLFSHPSCSGPN